MFSSNCQGVGIHRIVVFQMYNHFVSGIFVEMNNPGQVSFQHKYIHLLEHAVANAVNSAYPESFVGQMSLRIL